MVFLVYLLMVIMLIQKGSLAALHRLSISGNIYYSIIQKILTSIIRKIPKVKNNVILFIIITLKMKKEHVSRGGNCAPIIKKMQYFLRCNCHHAIIKTQKFFYTTGNIKL